MSVGGVGRSEAEVLIPALVAVLGAVWGALLGKFLLTCQIGTERGATYSRNPREGQVATPNYPQDGTTNGTNLNDKRPLRNVANTC
jgi:hypothetical protein